MQDETHTPIFGSTKLKSRKNVHNHSTIFHQQTKIIIAVSLCVKERPIKKLAMQE